MNYSNTGNPASTSGLKGMKGCVNWALLKSAHVLLRNRFLDGLGFEERLESWVANSFGISWNWNLACAKFHKPG